LIAAMTSRSRVNTRGAGLAIDTVGVDDRRVDRRALDDRALGREVAARERHRAGEAARAGALGIHHDVVGIHAVGRAEPLAQHRASLRLLPPVEHAAQALAAHGERLEVEETETAEVEHDLRHAAGEERAHGRMRPVGQRVDEAGHLPVHADPVVDGGPPQAGRVGDGRQVQQ